MATAKRWFFLENNPALLDPDWLPDEQAWPELAELRREHVRLLGIARDAAESYSAVLARHESEDGARSDAMRQAFLSGGDHEDEAPDQEARAAEVNEARVRAEAATDALVEFLTGAIAELQERAPQLYAELDGLALAAEAKREEAARLLAEAERHVGEQARRRFWLDRISGVSALGHFPFGQIDVPLPPPPPDLTALLAGGAATALEVANAG